MKGYTAFADYYDALTALTQVDYNAYVEKLETLFHRVQHTPNLMLDLACGTGSLTVLLKQKGYDVYGVDGSAEMLSVAQEKAYDAGESILFLCQEMTKLDLYGTVDTVICSLDSINHLIKEEAVLQALQKVSLFLEPGGCLFLDCNTPYKHREILGDNAFVYEADSVFCVWQNRLLEQDVVELTLDFFAQEQNLYRRETETFWERAYPLATLKRLLEEAGLTLELSLDFATLEKPTDTTERWMLVARKPKTL